MGKQTPTSTTMYIGEVTGAKRHSLVGVPILSMGISKRSGIRYVWSTTCAVPFLLVTALTTSTSRTDHWHKSSSHTGGDNGAGAKY